MSRVRTPEVSDISTQQLSDAGINPFAVQLLVESYASPGRSAPLARTQFTWRGVTITLEPFYSGLSQSALDLERDV